MNKSWLFLLVCMPNVCHGSFLTASKFPTNFQDLSFVERMATIQEGFEPWESEYDSNGVCIKNCAYHGITLKEEQERSYVDTKNSIADSLKFEQERQLKQSQTLSVDTTNIVSAVKTQEDTQQIANCANRNPNIRPGQSAPFGEPLVGMPRISSPYQLNRKHPVTGVNKPHSGIDYAVPNGTLVYTPADGNVVNVWKESDGCGYGCKIHHDDGTYAVYCHLSDVLVRPGDKVSAGCAVAKSGNSGASTGYHLHYGLKNKNDRFINPSEYTGRAD